jgi:hypothetical protein
VGLENSIASDELQEGWRTMNARKPAWMAGDWLAMAVRVVPDEGMRWGRQVIVDKVQPLWVVDKKLYAACIWGEGVQPGHRQSAGRVCRHPAPCTCTCPQCVSQHRSAKAIQTLCVCVIASRCRCVCVCDRVYVRVCVCVHKVFITCLHHCLCVTV